MFYDVLLVLDQLLIIRTFDKTNKVIFLCELDLSKKNDDMTLSTKIEKLLIWF